MYVRIYLIYEFTRVHPSELVSDEMNWFFNVTLAYFSILQSKIGFG